MDFAMVLNWVSSVLVCHSYSPAASTYVTHNVLSLAFSRFGSMCVSRWTVVVTTLSTARACSRCHFVAGDFWQSTTLQRTISLEIYAPTLFPLAGLTATLQDFVPINALRPRQLK
ncbi:hypothetical protein IWZ01DRAFT_488987 [Phyllosticta capitalensis]